MSAGAGSTAGPWVGVIPVLEDNFVFCLRNGPRAIVVDPGETEPVLEYLSREGLSLEGILLTHHHWDHVGGVMGLLAASAESGQATVPVWAPLLDQGRFPFSFMAVSEGNVLSLAGFSLRVMELPGHTLDHIAFFEPEQRWLFSGDVLFGYGCGRLFEGSFEQAFSSLGRIRDLPDETRVFCTHEYTMGNLRFLESRAADDSDRLRVQAFVDREKARLSLEGRTVPLFLSEQKTDNPFLAALSLDEFRELRLARNSF